MTWTPGAPRPPWLSRGRGAPPPGLYWSEVGRAVLDGTALLALAPLLSASPRGDGHPVLVLPGLIADDASTVPLRGYLKQLGYDVAGWELGRNIGPTPAVRAGIRRRLTEVTAEAGRRATVVGWSLGGIYARELAREMPAAVRQVVTLASPFRISHPDQSRAYRLFERYAHLHIDPSELPPPEASRPPLPVPATSIYSRLDGIVDWQACLDPVGPLRENVAVYSSHLGLGHNPCALWVVADRLAQPEGVWAPFRPSGLVRHLFPAPDAVEAAA